MGWWYDYPRERRRPANGIKAKTQRGKFGQTWWAGRWLAALERLVDTGRLSRGRSYARSGQVLDLDVGPKGVKSRVQGSRPRPYSVSIEFGTLSSEEWEKVIDAMAAEAIYAAKLLAGEMPQQIEEVFQAAGSQLFPATRKDLMTECSCPDWANPCKHVAAVYYLLGERFDDDPFLLFLLRGRSREEIAAALRARRAGAPAVEDVALADDSPEQAAEEDVPLLGATPEAFWSMSQDVSDLIFRFDSPVIDALPVKQRGMPAFWRSGLDFTTAMEEMYGAIERHARGLVVGDAPKD
jgi:uncharacterized Zn finger protein